MTVERRLGCEMVGLSTDAKPDYPGIIDYRFYEIDTGNIFYYGGASWSAIQGSKASLAYSNKIITAQDNDFEDSVAVDYPLSFGYHRSGSFIPAVSGPYLGGAFSGMSVITGSGENAFNGLDLTEGNYQNFRANTTGEKMGFQSTSSTNSMMSTRGQNARLVIRCKVDQTSGVRLYIGFTSNQTLPSSNTPLGTTDSGVIMGFGSTSSTFMTYVNDGAGGAASTQAFTTTKDNDWHTYDIAMSITTITCSLDGTPLLLATQLPNTSTTLFLNCVAQYV